MDVVERIQEFRDQVDVKRKAVRRDLRAKIEEDVDAVMLELETELSRRLHDAYGAGVSKTRLREAMRAYGNSSRWFDYVWGLVPDTHAPIPSRRRNTTSATVTVEAVAYEWIGDDSIAVTIGEDVVIVTNVSRVITPRELDGETWEDREDVFTVPDEHTSRYAKIASVVAEALNEKEDAL